MIMMSDELLEAYRNLFIYTEDAVLERIESLELHLEELELYPLGKLNTQRHKDKIESLKETLSIIQKDYEDNL